MRKLLFIAVSLTLILVGCSGESVANDMYQHLEETVEIEKTFVDQQEPFIELEQEEQDLYNQIIELSADEMDEITSLSEQAITTIDDRKELLQTELESIEAAEQEFSKVKDYVEDLEEDPKSIANDMIQTMEERYNTYGELNEAYHASLDQDKVLYELFMDEELTEEELRSQIETVNSSYDNVSEINNQFNELTEQYNQLKEDFYESAELNVVYE
ncbi:YkyA family protein [Gracilibacillus massiliensis]|uniref:YkyA family protein n=1 Tax=Gracilibacillus massiliensis TaxID=1564956 RepID=UPI00071C5B7A|nr:YkyA family protein [Gracilibacillus massiliensis]